MLQTAQTFLDALDARELKHSDVQELDNGKNLVLCGVNGEHCRYQIRFFFDEGQHSAAIRVFGLVRVNREHFAQAVLCANDLNVKFRWTKFNVDKDFDFNLEYDAVITPETAGDVCVEILMRFAGIIDQAYPQIMKAIYAD